MSNSEKAARPKNHPVLIYTVILSVIALVLDQITKYWARGLKGQSAIVLIPDVLELRYLENRGAAFGILQGKSTFFILVAVIVFIIMGYIFSKIPKERKYFPLNFSLAFMLAGAVGNTIDRVYFGFVTDFIYFKLIDFPTFNVADIWITCSTIFLIYLILFKYKEDDLEFMKNHKGKASEDEKKDSLN